MKVVLTEAARADLEAIGDHIAQDNPTRARGFIKELIASARAIGAAPRGSPLVPRYEHLGVRRRVHGAYLIFYRVEAARITILHVLHGARDYEALLFPQD